ncbi:Ribulose bisphosphate carboxylase small chain 1, chloroplastic [Glycine max]|nr:Ribulose bisphosphate carboxylase small chain 1, chloroplastic [Glycine max]
MASSMMSSPAVTTVNRSSMVAPFTGLKSMAGFPVTKTNYDINSIASNSERVQCMQQGFVYRENHRSPEYNDGRYWTMWKLPMIGCTDSAQVLKGVDEAVKAYPTAFVRIIGFDNVRQVQCIIFIAYKSPGY